MELSRVLGVTTSFFLEGVDGPSVEQALLDLKLITERDLLEAKSYCFKANYGEKDPEYPTWRLRTPDLPRGARD